jgi:CBS domain-containing protein
MKRHTVRDVMTAPAVSVLASARYHDIIESMIGHQVSALPVCDIDGCVVGVVSQADLLHKVEYAGTEREHAFERKHVRVGRAKADALLAENLMSGPAIVIAPNATINAAAATMSQHHIKRLPVVDSDGRLVGVVSRSDVLRSYLRSDDDIANEIRDDVVLGTMWIDPAQLSIDVRDGIAIVSGFVDRSSTASILVHLIEAVPGVLRVHDHIDARYDDSRRGAPVDAVTPMFH